MARKQTSDSGAIQAVRTGANTFKVLDWGESKDKPHVGIVFKDAGQLTEGELSVMVGEARPQNEWDTRSVAAAVAGANSGGAGAATGDGGAATGGGGTATTVPQPAWGGGGGGGGQYASDMQGVAGMGAEDTVGYQAPVPMGKLPDGSPPDPATAAAYEALVDIRARNDAGKAMAAAPATVPMSSFANAAQNQTLAPPGQFASAVPQNPFITNMSVADAAADPARMDLQGINQRINDLEVQQNIASSAPAATIIPKNEPGISAASQAILDQLQAGVAGKPQSTPIPDTMPMGADPNVHQAPTADMVLPSNTSFMQGSGPTIPDTMPMGVDPNAHTAQPDLQANNMAALVQLLDGMAKTNPGPWSSALGQ